MAEDAGGLSAAELAGIEKYGETITRDEVDAMLRDIPILGLDGYEMEYFSLQKVGDEFCAYVRYGMDGECFHAYTLNAVTGQLLMADTWYNAMVEPAEVGDPDALRADAAAFLALAAPDVAERFELSSAMGYNGTDWTKARMEYIFVRTENGIPFDQDTVSITLDAKTGFVDTYRFNWTEDVSFEGEVAMDMDAALAAWLAPLSAELHYADWDNGEGTQRVLSWVLMGEEPDYILAETGEAVRTRMNGKITYSDVSEGSAIRLAEYGIGYAGGEVNADAPLTVRDMLTLAMGLRNPDYILYSSDESLLGGYYVRGLGYAEEDLNREATALEFARVVVCTMEFGEAAKLPGIFRTDFTDEAEIPAEELGYAAIASALRLVEADETGAAKLGRVLTRGEALDMLDRMLSR